MLFKEFGGVDALPICLATKDVDEIVAAVKAIAPVFGGINLEDISAPRCFEIEAGCAETLDIPVFHDDQHGTAIVVARGAPQRARGRRQAIGGRPGRRHRRRRGRRRGDDDAARRRRRATSSAATARARLRAAGRASRRRRPRSPSCTNPRGLRGLGRRGARRRGRLHRPLAARRRHGRGHPRRWPTARSSSRWRTRRPRSLPEEIEDVRRGDRDRPLRLPEPDQQRARVPRRLPRRARRPRARRSTRR